MGYKTNWNDLIQYGQTILQADSAVIALVPALRIYAQDILPGGALPAILVMSPHKRNEEAVTVGNKPPEILFVLPIQVVTASKDSSGENRTPELMRQEAWNIVDEVERVIRDNQDWNEDGDYIQVYPDRVRPDFDIDEKEATLFLTLTIEVTIRKSLTAV